MASSVWDCFFCLLPSLLALLLSLALGWPRARCCTRLAVKAAGWRLWVMICLILELPLDRSRGIGVKEVRSPGTGVFGSGQVLDGLSLFCKPTALARYLLQHCVSLARPRLASWPRGDPHLQTLSSMLFGKHGDRLQFTRDHLLLRDGGIVALDWAAASRLSETDRRKRWEGRKEHQSGGFFTAAPPVLLVIPQYWGGMTPHLQVLCRHAVQQGYKVVVFHARGTAGCLLTTARLAEFGDPADLEQVVGYVHSRYPTSVLVAVSEGSGSGILLSYLGESGSSSHLTAAAAISPVLLGQLWFEVDMPPVYRWGVMFHQKMKLRRYASSFRGVLDVDRALSASSLRNFEEALSCSSAPTPPDWERYWERNEPLRDADEVAVPVLCVCSRDDPLLPPVSSLPLPLFQSNPYFLMALTERGGHCGFTLEVLEYFKVVTDFLKCEGREGASRSGLATMMRRPKLQPTEGRLVDAEEGSFTWKRSYTR
uniref:Abhydrolase domain containing 15 n=1 Tax=Mola mola TaxID=94237 RepID=A0A3Q3WP85_MOLML